MELLKATGDPISGSTLSVQVEGLCALRDSDSYSYSYLHKYDYEYNLRILLPVVLPFTTTTQYS